MGFVLYVICEDGDYVHFGKELELYGNHAEAVAMLMFIFSKHELHHEIYVRRFGLHDSDEQYLKNDCSESYLKEAKEELERP